MRGQIVLGAEFLHLLPQTTNVGTGPLPIDHDISRQLVDSR